jgi:hypothetical protein
MTISKAKGSVAGRKQFVEQVAEPSLENLDLSLSDRDLVGPVIGHGPLGPILLGPAPPSSNCRLQIVVEVVGQRPQRSRPSWSRFSMMSHGASAARRLLPENGANLSVAMPCPLTAGSHIARAEPSAHGGQKQGQRAPVEAASRRSRARAARALTGVGWSGSGLQSADGGTSFRSAHQYARLGRMPSIHCADYLSAKENSDSCKVRANH